MRIAGTGVAVPKGSVSNEEVESRLGLEPGWIARRTGILQRPTAAPDDATSDLAVIAGREALASAGLAADSIGLLLLATSTPDHPLPPTAPLVASRLNLPSVGAVDLAGACSGFLYAFVLASIYCDATQKPCLVIGANVLSRRVDQTDPATASLFADGAGAVVLSPSPTNCLLGHHFSSDGSLYETIIVRAGGTREPISEQAIADGRQLMTMGKGPGVFRKGVELMVQSAHAALSDARIGIEEVDWLIPHQANARMIHETGRQLGIPEDKTISVVGQIGNSSAATLPIAIGLAARAGKFVSGDILLLTSVGAGMIGAGAVLRW